MKIGDRIKSIRKQRKLNLSKLAELCSITPGYLSRIEHNQQIPVVSIIQKLSSALKVDLSELVDEPDSLEADGLDIQRASVPEMTQDGYSFSKLITSYKNKQMSPFLLYIAPGKTVEYTHDSEEFFYVISGSMELEYNRRSVKLSAGDSVYFDSRLPHSFLNPGKKPVIILTVNYNYRRF